MKSVIPKLFHGTLLENVPKIMENGIEAGEGWGGAGTSGAFLSGTPEGALYWAKMAYQRTHGEDMEAYDFDRDHGHEVDKLIAVVVVQIPDSKVNGLMADKEQFEDVGADFAPDDWKQSLKKIGDVRFDGPIPSSWIVEVIKPSDVDRLLGFSELPEGPRSEVLDHMSLSKAKKTKWKIRPVEPEFVYKQYGLPGVDQDQVKLLVQAIEKEGFTVPIVVDGIDGWMEGNHRAVAAQRLGLETIPAYTRER